MRGHHLPLDYHAGLLGDPVRVDAFHRAIRALVRPGDVVLDVGTGSGLLAMLAARCGAARVHAVESTEVARLAEALVEANGLDDVVVVHRADLVGMEPVEPVDLVIGEWLGRYVVDDEMLDAVAASAAWMKPGARCCPEAVELYLGLGARPIPAVERWRLPLRGLDLAPAEDLALHTAYAAAHRASDLLGPGVLVHTLHPPDELGWPIRDAVLEVARDGVLHALVGWWTAALAPGVSLTTAPGSPTHWGQYLWPLPATGVRAGDRVLVQLALEDGSPRAWRWRVRVERGADCVLDHSAHSLQSDAAPGPASAPVERAVQLSNDAAEAFARGDLAAALEGAAAATRGAASPAQSAVMHENLGLALVNLGRLTEAVDALLAALHEGPRPQALRFLVGCALRLGWSDAAAEWRAVHEAEIGPWTDPWG